MKPGCNGSDNSVAFSDGHMITPPNAYVNAHPLRPYPVVDSALPTPIRVRTSPGGNGSAQPLYSGPAATLAPHPPTGLANAAP
jgi:hypothetical protein